MPYQPWAVAQRRENRERYIEPNILCFLSGVPRTMYMPTVIQILQPPGYVVGLLEGGHRSRIIPTDGRVHLGESLKLWNGDSRGRWEENTLVVDVTNQNARAWFDQAANFYTDTAHMVERFTLIDPDTIHDEVAIEDPNVYTRPWRITFPSGVSLKRGMSSSKTRVTRAKGTADAPQPRLQTVPRGPPWFPPMKDQHVQLPEPERINGSEIDGEHAFRRAHDGPKRRGAGPMCAARNIFRTVVADTTKDWLLRLS